MKSARFRLMLESPDDDQGLGTGKSLSSYEMNSRDLSTQVLGKSGQRNSNPTKPNAGAEHLPSSQIVQKALTESEERQLMLRLEELARIEGLREDRARTRISAATQALIDGKADDTQVLKKDGSVILEGPLTLQELSADPDDPDEGHTVIWMSDGTGSGDDGDIMVKITAGGTTKTYTVVDFSSI